MTLQKLQPPIDFDSIRIALVQTMEAITGLPVIEHEPETQDAPRPPKPYMAYKITTPSSRMGGSDDHRVVLDNGGNPTTKQISGGQRKMTGSFHCYGRSHEEAYNYLTLWQGSLDMYTVKEALRKAGVAIWVIGNVADVSALLNTAYEGRAQMDCTFGIASNLTEDLGEMDTITIHGKIDTDAVVIEDDFTVIT